MSYKLALNRCLVQCFDLAIHPANHNAINSGLYTV